VVRWFVQIVVDHFRTGADPACKVGRGAISVICSS